MDNSTDTEVLRAAVDWLDEGAGIILVTVARTWGSAPRRAGALMAIHADGRFVGSVSGGCVEDELVQRTLRGEFEQQPPVLIEFGIDNASAHQIGLPCGGHLQLVVEYHEAAQPLREVLARMDAHQRITRRVCLGSGEASLHAARVDDDCVFDGDNLYKVFGPAWRMLVIGAGELSRRVAQLAMTLDYAVTICDSRPEYASDWQVEGTELSTLPPAQCVRDFEPDPYSVVLSLAHSPVLEDEALAAALNSDASYVGALGSRKNQQARLERLRGLGLSDAQLAQLHGPVGLDIGSRTPAEIAIAITAALIQARSKLVKTQSRLEVQRG